MRLTAKLVLAFIAVIAAVLGAYGAFEYHRELAKADRDLQRDAEVTARILAHDVAVTWRHEDRHTALILLDDPVLATRHADAVFVDDASSAPRPLQLGGTVQVVRAGRLETWAPVATPTGKLGAVVLRDSLAIERQQANAILRDTIASATFLAVASLLALGILGSMLIGRPTRLLVAKARRIGAGDLSQPLALRQRDELGEIAREVDAMCERLAVARAELDAETQRRLDAVSQLRHADRLMTVGKLASGVAHELGTPMNVVSGRARLIEDGEVEGEEARDSARIIVEQTRRMTTIIRRLLDFARRGEATRRRQDVVAPVIRAAGLLDAMARKAGVTLAALPAEPLEADVDEGQIEQVVTNLVVNAIHATPSGGRVEVSVARADAAPASGGPPRPTAVIRVVDTGRGMDDATRARIFEPFFTTKDVGEGTGLGLAVVWGIVTDHGGWITVLTAPGRGSTFEVYLPLCSPT